MTIELRSEISASLIEHGLANPDEELFFCEIAAGVSSQLWLVRSAQGSFVAKQPLSVLRSEIEWRAPLERGYFEYRWLENARLSLSELVPEVFAYDEQRRLLIMSYFDREQYRTLKELYLAEEVRADLAAAVGAALAKVHSAFAADASLKAEFAARDVLAATRIDPYFTATAARHPDLANIIDGLAESLLTSDLTVIHGDISPKNILAGPTSPIFLDSECACIGDPSFDVAFFITHLFLKCVIRPDSAENFIRSANTFYSSYIENVDPNIAEAVRNGAGPYLGVFLLARIDGKSRVEYLTDRVDVQFVRGFSRDLLQSGAKPIPEAIEMWGSAIASRICDT